MSFLSFKYLDSNTFTLFGGRNSHKVFSTYLDSPSGVPFNVSPFVLPYDCFLTNITVSTSLPGTCSVFVRSNGVDVIGASVTLTNSASIAENFAIQLTGNQPIEIYLQTISPVSHPNVNLIFQKNI